MKLVQRTRAAQGQYPRGYASDHTFGRATYIVYDVKNMRKIVRADHDRYRAGAHALGRIARERPGPARLRRGLLVVACKVPL